MKIINHDDASSADAGKSRYDLSVLRRSRGKFLSPGTEPHLIDRGENCRSLANSGGPLNDQSPSGRSESYLQMLVLLWFYERVGRNPRALEYLFQIRTGHVLQILLAIHGLLTQAYHTSQQ